MRSNTLTRVSNNPGAVQSESNGLAAHLDELETVVALPINPADGPSRTPHVAISWTRAGRPREPQACLFSANTRLTADRAIARPQIHPPHDSPGRRLDSPSSGRRKGRFHAGNAGHGQSDTPRFQALSSHAG